MINECMNELMNVILGKVFFSGLSFVKWGSLIS